MDVYVDISKAPLDEYTTPDEVDQPNEKKRVLSDEKFEQMRQVLSAAPTTHPRYVIPFTHALKSGSKGKDVVGAKRAIWAALDLPVPIGATQLFGPTAVKELKIFQKEHGLKQDGVLGVSTLKKLAPFFDAFAFSLYVGYPPNTTKKQQQQKLFTAYLLWGYNNRDRIGYDQFRPMRHMDELMHLPEIEDCSTVQTKACKYAGMKDPNGFKYNGFGYTGTMAPHGVRVSGKSKAQVGDLAFYGPAPAYEHTTGVVSVTKNGVRVVSHGSSSGPLLLDIDYRSDRGLIKRYI